MLSDIQNRIADWSTHEVVFMELVNYVEMDEMAKVYVDLHLASGMVISTTNIVHLPEGHGLSQQEIISEILQGLIE